MQAAPDSVPRQIFDDPEIVGLGRTLNRLPDLVDRSASARFCQRVRQGLPRGVTQTSLER